MSRYLTKSRFKLALSCPKKLYYTGKDQYPNINNDDSFLEALAEGGYQVGFLARCYYPEGIEVNEQGYEVPLQITNDLLSRGKVTIFEAAFRYKNLFIRADIIEKKGDRINLIEVKAKSFNGTSSDDFINKDGYLMPIWRDYLYDVAFQKYVISQALPNYKVSAYLMLANKNAVAAVDGLNQKFLLKTVEGERTIVEIIGDVSKDALGEEILIRVNVDDIVERIFDGNDSKTILPQGFTNYVHFLADKYEKDEPIIVQINKNCKECEFRTISEQEAFHKKSGYKECWMGQLGWTDDKFSLPQMIDIWDFRKKDDMIQNGKYHMRDISKDDIGDLTPNTDGGLTRTERQWLQVRKTVDMDTLPYIDIEGLRDEFKRFRFPLHFIDFETSMVAIPFFKGRRPYEQIAFQFSHHVVKEDLSIEHKGQYLCEETGMFPNFDFVRKLRSELENDHGTIFRYADHENTVLNQIMVQLNSLSKTEVEDRDSLVEFIKTITHSANHSGERDMVDLKKLVTKYYYHNRMGGSNSIKAVLPAVITSSEFIQHKYSQPIYGKNSLIKSLNFEDGWVWIKKDNGEIISPYKLLPPLFEGIDAEQIEDFFMRYEIKDGGAALTAYAKLQFTSMSETEKELIINGLFKYCELDTLAMVLIWEYWHDTIKRVSN